MALSRYVRPGQLITIASLQQRLPQSTLARLDVPQNIAELAREIRGLPGWRDNHKAFLAYGRFAVNVHTYLLMRNARVSSEARDRLIAVANAVFDKVAAQERDLSGRVAAAARDVTGFAEGIVGTLEFVIATQLINFVFYVLLSAVFGVESSVLANAIDPRSQVNLLLPARLVLDASTYFMRVLAIASFRKERDQQIAENPDDETRLALRQELIEGDIRLPLVDFFSKVFATDWQTIGAVRRGAPFARDEEGHDLLWGNERDAETFMLFNNFKSQSKSNAEYYLRKYEFLLSYGFKTDLNRNQLDFLTDPFVPAEGNFVEDEIVRNIEETGRNASPAIYAALEDRYNAILRVYPDFFDAVLSERERDWFNAMGRPGEGNALRVSEMMLVVETTSSHYNAMVLKPQIDAPAEEEEEEEEEFELFGSDQLRRALVAANGNKHAAARLLLRKL